MALLFLPDILENPRILKVSVSMPSGHTADVILNSNFKDLQVFLCKSRYIESHARVTVAAHTFNPSTPEAEVGKLLRSGPAWGTW